MFKLRNALFPPITAALLAALFAVFDSSLAGAQDIEAGRKLAQRNCAACHSIGAKGKSALSKAPPFRDIAAKGKVDDLQEALAEGIMVGHPAMPEFKLQPHQIGDFLAFMKSLAPAAR